MYYRRLYASWNKPVSQQPLSLCVLKKSLENIYSAYLYIGPISMAFPGLNNAWGSSLPILINYSFTSVY